MPGRDDDGEPTDERRDRGPSIRRRGLLGLGAMAAAGLSGCASLGIGGDGGDLPPTVHVVNDYPGSTLDRKLRAVVDELRGAQDGHRILVPPPEPGSEAAHEDTAIWRFEEPVVFDRNTGKLVIDMGWTIAFATAGIENFFVIGPDEKTENITFNGGFLYARGNVASSFLLINGIGHMDINAMYLQSLEGRNTVPAGIHIENDHGNSGITITGTEVTGCTHALLCEPGRSPESVFGLDVYDWRGGGGETSIAIDGCRNVSLDAIEVGGADIQSISGDVVRLKNTAAGCRNVTVTNVRETNNDREYDSGVRALAVDDGIGPKHDGLWIRGVDLENAAHSTAIEHAEPYSQRDLAPPPASPGDGARGASRYHDPGAGANVFDSDDPHQFRVGGETGVSVLPDGIDVGDGGIRLAGPDGTTYRLSVDGNGDLVTEAVGE